MIHNKSTNSTVNRHHLSDSESGINAKFKLDINKLSANKLAKFLVSRQYSHNRYIRIVLPD